MMAPVLDAALAQAVFVREAAQPTFPIPGEQPRAGASGNEQNTRASHAEHWGQRGEGVLIASLSNSALYVAILVPQA